VPSSHDHGYDEQVSHLSLHLDEEYVEGFVEGYLQRIGENDPKEERLFRDLWGTRRSGMWRSKASRPSVRSARSVLRSTGQEDPRTGGRSRVGRWS